MISDKKYQKLNDITSAQLPIDAEEGAITKKLQEANKLMHDYYQLKDNPDNTAACQTLKDKVGMIMFRNYKKLIHTAKKYYAGRGTDEDCQDAVQETICKSIEEYDSQKSNNFCAYFFECLKYTVQNALGEEYIDTKPQKEKAKKNSKKKTSADTNKENTGRYIKRGQSIEPLTDTSNTSDTAPLPHPDPAPDVQTVNRMSLEEYYTRMAVCVIRISPDNNYFRAFATERYIMLCREHLNTILDINENEAFNDVMNLDFSDFTLEEKCRSFVEIETTPCKFYSEFALYPIGDSEKSQKWVGRLQVPFDNPIFAKFFGCTDSNIIRQRKNFEKKVGIVR